MASDALKKIAYLEAAALLSADCDSAELQCESSLSQDDADKVREIIREEITEQLRSEARRIR